MMKRIIGLLLLLCIPFWGWSQTKTIKEDSNSGKTNRTHTNGLKATKWIEVKKHATGFLIYDPCDGDTFFMDYSNPKEILLHWAIEQETRSYSKIKRNQTKTDLHLKFVNGKETQLDLKISPYDLSKQVYLLEFDQQKILATPYQNIKNFKQIENECPDHKVPEFDFLPI